jgi:hypothetical protein
LPEAKSIGIVVAEEPGSDTAIPRRSGTVTAFVGRTLRGPIDRPVAVHSYAEFHQIFGGLWQPSTLAYAVEQFFENGGREAIVVRVVNGGRPATISLPCGREVLTLIAQSPGSREALRASVDYDNIAPNEEDRFNLIVQRVRAVGSEHIEDQEIFRRVSCLPGSTRFVATALQESMLLRVHGPVPATRPDRTFRPGARHPIGYVDSNPDGDDGAPLTDYDIIGSAERGTGLFALRGLPEIDFVCVPPLSREHDVGPSVLVVASQLCRDQRAILIVDPPASWRTCEDAIRGLRELSLQNENAIMCFPRVLAYDRLRARYEVFANCGAVAGALVRMEQARPWHRPEPDDELLLRPGSRPARILTETERQRLAAHGINPIQSIRAANPRPTPLRTLARGTAGSADGNLLTPRRRVLLTMTSLEAGTRWAMFEAGDRRVWPRLERQVRTFLQPLAAAQLFGAGPVEDAFYVVCDERLNTEEDLAEGRVNVLVGLRSTRSADYQSFLITHGIEGSSLRPVRSNWLPAGTRMTVPSSATREPDVANDDDITVPRRTLQAAQSLVRRVSSRRSGEPVVPRVGPLAPEQDTAKGLRTPDVTAVRGSPVSAETAAETAVARETPRDRPVEAAPSPGAASEPPTAPAPVRQSAADNPLAVPPATRSLDRDDIARFYRDLNGPGN